MESHLLQMRGLKLNRTTAILNNRVASFTDAWIETDNTEEYEPPYMSHLLQMRGLKHMHFELYTHYDVASFTDAWIETL